MNDTPESTPANAPSEQRDRVTTLPCPYCGDGNPSNAYDCKHCGGIFEPLSRQATQNAMGPWFIRDTESPFSPGCSYETLRKLVRRGRIVATSVVRGPSTNQFWMHAKDVPGVAILLGMCHTCHAEAQPEDFSCSSCGSVLSPATSRDALGLAPVTPVNRSPIAPSPTASPTSEAAKSLTLGGFVPITSPNDARNMTNVGTTLSPYLQSATPARAARPQAPAAPVRSAPTPTQNAPSNASPVEHQATIRRLRTQIRSTKMFNVILLIVSGLLTVGLVLAVVLPGALGGAPLTSTEPERRAAEPQAGALPPRPETASSPEPERTALSPALDEARTLAEPGTEAALAKAITLLNTERARLLADGDSEPDALRAVERELETLNDRLDALRLERMLSVPSNAPE